MKSSIVVQPNGTRERCRLCHTLGELMHSHVISRLMFRRMSQLASETPHRFDPIGGTDQPGHLKEYMLCQKCEKQFGSYEQIAGPFLAKLNGFRQQAHTQSIHQSSLDYRNIKLFFLSVIWRCAIAGITPRPDGAFMMQVAGNLTDTLDGFLRGKRLLDGGSNPPLLMKGRSSLIIHLCIGCYTGFPIAYAQLPWVQSLPRPRPG